MKTHKYFYLSIDELNDKLEKLNKRHIALADQIIAVEARQHELRSIINQRKIVKQ